MFKSGFSKRHDNNYDEPKELSDILADIESGACDDLLDQFK